MPVRGAEGYCFCTLRHTGERYPQDVGYAARRLHGCRRYGYREVTGRVEPGAETESDAGAKAEDRTSKAATHRTWGMPREDRMSEAATHRTWGMPREDRMSEAAGIQGILHWTPACAGVTEQMFPGMTNAGPQGLADWTPPPPSRR